MQVRSGNPTLQNGLLFGMILGILEILLSFLLGGPGLILSALLFLFLVGYAGYRSSARTGKVSSGLLAGLLVGLLSTVIATIPLLIYYLSNIDAFRAQLQQEMTANNLSQGITLTNSLVIASVILLLVVLVVGATLLGLCIGSIGGAIGKGQAPRLPVYQPPYPAPPYPPQSQQSFMPTPPPVYQPPYLPQDYTSPEAYMTPQEKPSPTPPPESGPSQ